MARGRKSGAILWRPDVVEEEGPIFVASLRKQPIGEVLRAASKLPDPELLDDKVSTISDVYLRWAVGDVVRRRWCPRMKIGTLGKKKFTALEKRHIEAEGLVLSRLLDLAAEVFLLNDGGYDDYAYWWFNCCREVNAHRLSAMHTDNYSPTKRDIVSVYEGHSAKLRKRQNPFTLGPSAAMFDTALKLADSGTNSKTDSEHFYPKKFIPYLEARANLAQIVRKKEFGVFAVRRCLNLNNPLAAKLSAPDKLALKPPENHVIIDSCGSPHPRCLPIRQPQKLRLGPDSKKPKNRQPQKLR